MFQGWVQPLLVLGLFLTIELLASNVAEPRLYGRSIGVSEVALLVAAALWAFLWGPIGLVLSSPLTVCLVVLGKYVPQLKFLDVLLGDEPPLDAHITFYQRLLARDQDEATQLILAQAKASSPEQVYDDFLVPALNYAKRDRERDDLTQSEEESVLQAMREILEDLGERRDVVTQAEEAIHAEERSNASPPIPLRVLACPARDQADRLALEMLRQVLDPAKWVVEIAAVETLTADLVAQVAEQAPALVCIGALPPGGLAHTRYLCKKLRARFLKVKIVVGRWGLSGNIEANREQLQDAGADLTAATILETRRQLNSLLPTLMQQQAKPVTSGKDACRPRRLCRPKKRRADRTRRHRPGEGSFSMSRLREWRSVQILYLLKQSWLEWYQSRAFEHGAALAFYAIFSIAPVIVLAFTAASLALGREAAQGWLTQEIESTVGQTVAHAIQATAQYTYRSGSNVPATVLSIVFFGFGATGAFQPTANRAERNLEGRAETGAGTARKPVRSVRIIPGLPGN